MEDSDQDDAIFNRPVEENESVDVPASQVGSEFRSGTANQIVVGQESEFLFKKPDDHLGVLGTGLGDIVFNGNVILPAFPGFENARHGD